MQNRNSILAGNSILYQLDLPNTLITKLLASEIITEQDLDRLIRKFMSTKTSPIAGISENDIVLIKKSVINFRIENVKSRAKKTTTPKENNIIKSTNKTKELEITQSLSKSNSEQKKKNQPNKTSRTINDSEKEIQLSKLEAHYSKKLKNITLISEIPIERLECEEIGKLLHYVLNKYNLKNGIGNISKKYPAILLVFLTGVGIYEYDLHGYWPAVFKYLQWENDKQRLQDLLKKKYEKLLPMFSLPDFKEERAYLEGKTFYYVRLILLHGGIPKGSLIDLFEKIVKPICEDRNLEGLDLEDQLEEIKQRFSYDQMTNKAVTEFLEHGGNIAIDFLERAVQMYQAKKESDEILSADELGLPKYVVNAFENWSSNKCLMIDSIKSNIRKPEIRLDPWGIGLYIYLPPQRISVMTENENIAKWSIEINNQSIPIITKVSNIGELSETQSVEYLLDEPFKSIDISFQSQNKCRKWHFEPIHEQILAFSSKTGSLSKNLRSGSYWILNTKDIAVKVSPENTEMYEILPDLGGAWSSYFGQAWDFSKTNKVFFEERGKVKKEIDISQKGKTNKPELLEVNRFRRNSEQDFPLYTGSPPIIEIPLDETNPKIDLSRWKLEIKNIGISDPEIKKVNFLTELNGGAYKYEGNRVQINLDSKHLLGPRAFGHYHIRAIGPLGRSESFRISILPEFYFQGNDEPFIQSKNNQENIEIECSAGLTTGVQIIDQDCKIEKKDKERYQLLIPPSKESFRIRVFKNYHLVNNPTVEVLFKVKSLKWKLIQDQLIDQSWSSSVIRFPLFAFTQQEKAILIVNFPHANESKTLELSLENFERQELQNSKQKYDLKKVTSQNFRFDLSQFRDTLASTTSPIYNFSLIIRDKESKNIDIKEPLISIRQELILENFKISLYDSPDMYHFEAKWREVAQLKSRAIFIWPIWRPWELPLVIEIPDNKMDRFSFSKTKIDLPPGEYFFEMRVYDSWTDEINLEDRPISEKSDCVEITISNPTVRVQQLYEIIKGKATFSNHFELMIVNNLLPWKNDVLELGTWCCRNIITATGREINTFHRFLIENKFTSLISLLNSECSKPEILEYIISENKRRFLPDEDLVNLANNILQSISCSKESCLSMLKANQQTLQLAALRKLIDFDIQAAFEYFIEFNEKNLLDIENIIELLEPHKNKVIKFMRENDHDNVLCNQLASFYAEGDQIFEIGDWLLAGPNQGYITEIYVRQTRENKSKFLKTDPEVQLIISLHSSFGHDEKVIFEPATGKLIFHQNKGPTFDCPICGFITKSKYSSREHRMATDHDIIATNKKEFILTDYYFEKKIRNNDDK